MKKSFGLRRDHEYWGRMLIVSDILIYWLKIQMIELGAMMTDEDSSSIYIASLMRFPHLYTWHIEKKVHNQGEPLRRWMIWVLDDIAMNHGTDFTPIQSVWYVSVICCSGPTYYADNFSSAILIFRLRCSCVFKLRCEICGYLRNTVRLGSYDPLRLVAITGLKTISVREHGGRRRRHQNVRWGLFRMIPYERGQSNEGLVVEYPDTKNDCSAWSFWFLGTKQLAWSID